MKQDTDRRTFLLAAGGAATTVALAGCSGNGDEDENGGDGATDDTGGEKGDDTGDENGGGGGPDGVPEEVHQYLTENEANLYEDELVDMTGEDAITIMNGAGEDNVAFDPAAIRIDAGTEVTWEWTGLGGAHNVVSRDVSDFEFSNPDGLTDEEGHTWTYTFEETGNGMYHCEAHTALGQHGAIVVE
jgi:serine/threonine-protein kinase